uniref:Putative esf1 n=1 Tax=Triatoma dimidiata TaxID=72491 RepID=A0A0V0G7T7_TRIDM
MGDLFQDKRFNHVGSDPRFKNLPRRERKIKIDKRFQSVFTDKKFQLKYAVDIRGRPVRETQSDNYKKYYDISSEDNSDESEESDENLGELDESSDVSGTNDINLNNHAYSISHQKSDEVPDLKAKADSEKSKKLNKKVMKEVDDVHKTKISDTVHGRLQDMSIDYARGIGTIMSDSSSDDSDSDESDSVFVEHPWGELDKDAETTDEATRRLAICFLDWDRIYAKDLMVLLHSFLPADGIIESVTVYPSEFGLERMKEEELRGPKELVELDEAKGFEEDDCEDDTEGRAYHIEKLREYQLNRLKYYYAVVVCNNVETANKLYAECNGMEYESCAAKIDMRFIQDDMTFEQEPREVCTSLPDVTKYKPRLFENSALRQGKVALTWDETDPCRIEFNKRLASGEINDEDINNYIAGSSEESEEGETDLESNKSDSESEHSSPKDKLSKYKSLIASLKSEEEKKKNKDVEMEISWGLGSTKRNSESDDGNRDSGNDDSRITSRKTKASTFKMKHKPLFRSAESEDSSTDNSIPQTSSKKKILRKGKKWKKTDVPSSDEEKRNAELELLITEDVIEESKKQHFSLTGIQKQEKEGKAKKKKWRKELKKKINSTKEEDNFNVDVADNRFSTLYTSHLFNIDPTHPQFRKTKGMEEFVAEKQKRRKLQELNAETNDSKKKLNPELASLVSSIKGKTTNKMKLHSN